MKDVLRLERRKNYVEALDSILSESQLPCVWFIYYS